MKKIIPILLTLLLLVGLMPIGAFAAEEKCETFICDGVTTMVEGEYFNLSAKFGIGKGGWEGGYVHYEHSDQRKRNRIAAIPFLFIRTVGRADPCPLLCPLGASSLRREAPRLPRA